MTVEYCYLIGFIFLIIPVFGEILYLTYYRLTNWFCRCRKPKLLREDNQDDETIHRLEATP